MSFFKGFIDEIVKIASYQDHQDFLDSGAWDKGDESVNRDGNPVLYKQTVPQDVERKNRRQDHFIGKLMGRADNPGRVDPGKISRKAYRAD